jgi:hypothetical protein
MNSSPAEPATRVARAAVGCASGGFARKSGICADVLVEAHRLARDGRFGAPLRQLVARAYELLDELDELLVTLRPTGNSREICTAAALHRELELLQHVIAARQPDRGSAPDTVIRR